MLASNICSHALLRDADKACKGWVVNLLFKCLGLYKNDSRSQSSGRAVACILPAPHSNYPSPRPGPNGCRHESLARCVFPTREVFKRLIIKQLKLDFRNLQGRIGSRILFRMPISKLWNISPLTLQPFKIHLLYPHLSCTMFFVYICVT